MNYAKIVITRIPILEHRRLKILADCDRRFKSYCKEWGIEKQLPNIAWYTYNDASELGVTIFGDNSITLNEKLFSSNPMLLKQTIYHEMAHLIAGYEVNHGKDWTKLVNKINEREGTKISAYTDPTDMDPAWEADQAEKAKHIYRCRGCGKFYFVNRENDFTRRYKQENALGEKLYRCSNCLDPRGYEEVSKEEYYKAVGIK